MQNRNRSWKKICVLDFFSFKFLEEYKLKILRKEAQEKKGREVKEGKKERKIPPRKKKKGILSLHLIPHIVFISSITLRERVASIIIQTPQDSFLKKIISLIYSSSFFFLFKKQTPGVEWNKNKVKKNHREYKTMFGEGSP